MKPHRITYLLATAAAVAFFAAAWGAQYDSGLLIIFLIFGILNAGGALTSMTLESSRFDTKEEI